MANNYGDPTAAVLDEVSADTSPDDAPDQHPDDVEPDLSTMATRLAAAETLAGTALREVRRYESAVGRVPKLVSDMQSLLSRAPTADPNPRLDELQGLLDTLIDNLDDMALNANGRASLSERRSAAARSRELDKVRDELRSELKPPTRQTEPDAAVETAVAYEFSLATQRIAAFADALGVAPESVPDDVLTFKDGEAVADAEVRVKAAIRAIATGDTTAGRTAARRSAAGTATRPAREGTAQTEDALLKKAATAVPLSEQEQVDLVATMKRLGI